MGLYPKAINEYLAIVGIPRGPNSNVFIVDAANGDDDATGKDFKHPMATIAAAFAKCTANQHDVVLVLSGSSSNTLSAKLDWSKNYTHLIGMCAPTMAAQRARIMQLSTLTGASPLITVSASGCIFKDLYIFQGVDDATSLINVSVTGGRNYFENVHFAGGGHATMAINGGASLKLDGAEENLFRHCTIGVDTIASGTGHVGILFDGAALRNVFEDCHISMYAGHTGAAFVEVADDTGIDRYTIFKDCLFTNTNKANYEMASGFVIPAIAANRPARIFLKDCLSYGQAKWDASDRGVLMGNMDAVTGADASGLAVEMIS
jgi:microcompartment protein CcmK/EutM